jgi:hypothetical protein
MILSGGFLLDFYGWCVNLAGVWLEYGDLVGGRVYRIKKPR